ncbi:hypothetical protein FDUTEX481_08088 [Tolypothrix sp. PCC 7601]|nr:hypothetical protein FDUTEX481_08088 [Tolypothrix sp. PCC 7601]
MALIQQIMSGELYSHRQFPLIFVGYIVSQMCYAIANASYWTDTANLVQ